MASSDPFWFLSQHLCSYIISSDIWFSDNYTLFGVLPRNWNWLWSSWQKEKRFCGFWIGRFESVKLLYFITFTCESPFLVTAIPLQWETSIRVHRRSVLSRNRNRELKRKALGWADSESGCLGASSAALTHVHTLVNDLTFQLTAKPQQIKLMVIIREKLV